ncbi:hypothetical protein Tco_0851578 [Tanacetum coccineum]
MIWLRVEAASTSHSLPLPPLIILSHTRPTTPSLRTPPLHLLSTNCREDRPEVTLPPQKRLGIALGPAYEVGESSSAAAARPARRLRAGLSYGGDPRIGAPVSTAQNDKESGRQAFGLCRLNILFRDRRALARTARLIETEARMSREAWGRSMDASDLARAEPCVGSIVDLEVLLIELEVGIVDCFWTAGTCGELDAFVSIPDEGDMTFLRKKGKSGAAVGKLVLLQLNSPQYIGLGVVIVVSFEAVVSVGIICSAASRLVQVVV